MSDRDVWPRRPFAQLDPEPGGFEEAMARGRRRRWRTSGASAVVSLSAVVLAISLTGSAPDTDARLEITRLPEQLADTGPEDAEDATAAALDVAPPAAATGSGRSAGRGDGSPLAAQPDSRTAGTSEAAPSSAATRPAVSARTRRPAPPAERTEQDLNACSNLSFDQPWCLHALRTMDGPKDERTGDSTVSISVCLGRVSTTARTLSFRGEQQVDFVITKEGSTEVLWQWSHNALFRGAATADTVGAGECRIYSVRWLAESDNNGDFINERGSYVLTATSLARELGTNNSATYRFDLT